jgi:dihydropteroate synthase
MNPTRIGPTTFHWGTRTFVMGILNATTDSFSGDGLMTAPDPVASAVALARQMVAEGVDLLDIGGESTRPGHVRVSEADELARVVPIVAAVREALPATPLSVDTTRPAVAEAAVAVGANLLNDVWGTGADDGMARVAARHRLPLVVMHNRVDAAYGDVVREVVADLAEALERARALGVAGDGLIVDPGFGFGKTADHNVMLLRGLGTLSELARPILLGTSRKSTLGRIVGLPPTERLEATLATTALGIAAGVDIVRVHDVGANVRAARVADAVVRGTWTAAESGA